MRWPSWRNNGNTLPTNTQHPHYSSLHSVQIWGNVSLVINNVGTRHSGGSNSCSIVLHPAVSWLSWVGQSYDSAMVAATKPGLRHSTSGTKMSWAALECKQILRIPIFYFWWYFIPVDWTLQLLSNPTTVFMEICSLPNKEQSCILDHTCGLDSRQGSSEAVQYIQDFISDWYFFRYLLMVLIHNKLFFNERDCCLWLTYVRLIVCNGDPRSVSVWISAYVLLGALLLLGAWMEEVGKKLQDLQVTPSQPTTNNSGLIQTILS